LEHCSPYLMPIVITALNTGMRKMEILSLKWASVDLSNNVITLDHADTKSKKTRRVPLNSTMRTLLLEQKAKTQKTGYVFLSSKGTPYGGERHIQNTWLKTLKDAGITGLRFHDLRHTFATRAIESGASIVAVSKILGHADLKTTMRYTHPEDSLKDAVEKLENFTLTRSNFRSNENSTIE
ncbi:MAG TPA: site-specific integrase, partial [Thermodesulfobacteriota bacterium]|nr:site-specific integrase [Thermodesulfobacteriota bacterium]